ncbi:MAG TPA: glycosyltransferase family 9 protein [Fimbriimonadaceae bacterium]|nr:glycosyltransferase family 9 protein [Fimbriimonadaceae bacterium]
MAKRFLISRLSSLGDVVCSLPAASALKAAFPDCEVTWVVDPRFTGVVRSCSHVDSIVEAKPAAKSSTWPTFEGEFDAALDLQGLLKSALGIKNAKAKEKLGYHWQREGSWLFSGAVRPDPSSLHIVDQYVDVARAAGGVADRADFGMSPTAEAQEWLATRADLPEKYIVLNAGAGWVTKRWPADSFARLIEKLADAGWRCVLIGGPAAADREVAEEIKRTCRAEFVGWVGQTNVEQLIAVISRASAHVGGDTGSSHLAAALNIPAIGLYSITRPVRSCPYGQIERCLYNPSGLKHIEVESVAEKLFEVLP